MFEWCFVSFADCALGVHLQLGHQRLWERLGRHRLDMVGTDNSEQNQTLAHALAADSQCAVRTRGFCESLCWLVIGQSHLGLYEHVQMWQGVIWTWKQVLHAIEALTVTPIHCDFIFTRHISERIWMNCLRAKSASAFTWWIQSRVLRDVACLFQPEELCEHYVNTVERVILHKLWFLVDRRMEVDHTFSKT